jgi:hypothetical protein
VGAPLGTAPHPSVASDVMPPAASKAPLDYLLAIVICLITIGVSFKVEPPETRWIVFTVGVVMAVAVLLAALRPVRR